MTELIHSDRAIARPMAGTLKFAGDATGANDLEIEQGTDVLCTDGEKIGEAVDVISDHLVVEHGFFIPSDLYIPKVAISGHDDAGVYLKLTKEQFDAQDWSEEPDGDFE